MNVFSGTLRVHRFKARRFRGKGGARAVSVGTREEKGDWVYFLLPCESNLH